jgi:hypothetical protein
LAARTKRKRAPKSHVQIFLATAKGSDNYKVDVKMSLETGKEGFSVDTEEFRAVLDTGAAPVIVRFGALPVGVDLFPLTDVPVLVDSQRKAFELLGVVKGRIHMGVHSYRITALVA